MYRKLAVSILSVAGFAPGCDQAKVPVVKLTAEVPPRVVPTRDETVVAAPCPPPSPVVPTPPREVELPADESRLSAPMVPVSWPGAAVPPADSPLASPEPLGPLVPLVDGPPAAHPASTADTAIERLPPADLVQPARQLPQALIPSTVPPRTLPQRPIPMPPQWQNARP